MYVNDELSIQKSNDHLDGNSDRDLSDHNVVTSDIVDKPDNQNIMDHTNVRTQSLQNYPNGCHHN